MIETIAYSTMKIGDVVTIDDIKDQSDFRWVVLTNLIFDEDGDIDGGTVECLESSKVRAGNRAIELDHQGIETYLVAGAVEGICIGEVFVA